MPADIATLLAEAPWLARLARSLTGDGAEADDLVQETYAAALRSPPETDRPIRPWLRHVAKNLARMRHRGSSRRAANESVVEAQSDPVRTPEQLVERAQLERRLAELVLELEEPFRATVLLRYREGLSAEQIAKERLCRWGAWAPSSWRSTHKRRRSSAMALRCRATRSFRCTEAASKEVQRRSRACAQVRIPCARCSVTRALRAR